MTDLPRPYQHIAMDQVGSTNKAVIDAVADGMAAPLWVTANVQTAGRGRRGRPWVSEEGNLYSSLCLIDPAPMTEVAHLPLVIATAVHRAICDSLPPNLRAQLSIKWPNDVLWGALKVCGILLENTSLPDGRSAVVIGIGVNCRTHPDKTDGLGAAHLGQSGFDIDPKILFGRLAFHVADRLECWDQGRGLAAIREDWMGRARGIGQSIIVRLPSEELHGVFEQLDPQGGLVLLMPSGERRVIYAGDVFWPSVS